MHRHSAQVNGFNEYLAFMILVGHCHMGFGHGMASRNYNTLSSLRFCAMGDRCCFCQVSTSSSLVVFVMAIVCT